MGNSKLEKTSIKPQIPPLMDYDDSLSRLVNVDNCSKTGWPLTFFGFIYFKINRLMVASLIGKETANE